MVSFSTDDQVRLGLEDISYIKGRGDHCSKVTTNFIERKIYVLVI